MKTFIMKKKSIPRNVLKNTLKLLESLKSKCHPFRGTGPKSANILTSSRLMRSYSTFPQIEEGNKNQCDDEFIL